MKTKLTITATLAAAIIVSGCAQNAAQVTANYVPTNLYAYDDCGSLTRERNQIVYEVNRLTGKQNAKASTDAVAVGVGALLFWPALFLLAKDAGNTEQLADAKGRFDAIERAGVSKGCWS